jgi:hypothetical protein
MPDLTLPLSHAHFIWYCAWLSIPSTLYAYSSTQTAHFAIVPASVFTTSILYWRNPITNSWQRKLDIIVVLNGLTYQTYHLYSSNADIDHSTYTFFVLLSLVLYVISNYLMKNGYTWPATYTHACIHLFGNIANIALYKQYQNIL